LFKYIYLFGLLIFLTSCSSNPRLANLFAPNSALTPQTNSHSNDPVNLLPNEQNHNQLELQLPSNFPPDIPLYPQAKLVKVEDNTTLWSSSDPSNLIISYYEQELLKEKWQLKEKEDNFITAIQPESKQSLQLSLIPSGEETNFSLTFNQLNPEANSPNQSTTTKAEPETAGMINSKSTEINSSVSPLPELIKLKIIDNQQADSNPYQIITRREYARWLFKANNLLFADVNSKLIRLANPSTQPAFNDVNQNDSDFRIIQGLAEAGLIPSRLTQDTGVIAFRPDSPLTREDLIAWKVPLDFRQNLPPASLDNLKETWGFQDVTKIKPQVWQELYVDWQNGEDANIRRAFGYITLFQPQKSVTYEEAARVLMNFGYQGDVRSLTQVASNVN
jgi:hypothetical protein